MCKDCPLSKYNRVLLHYSVSIVVVVVVDNIPLSAVVVDIPLSAVVVVVDTHHCSVDTDELFHAYFFLCLNIASFLEHLSLHTGQV